MRGSFPRDKLMSTVVEMRRYARGDWRRKSFHVRANSTASGDPSGRWSSKQSSRLVGRTGSESGDCNWIVVYANCRKCDIPDDIMAAAS